MTCAWGDINIGEILAPVHGTLMSGSPGTVLSGISSDSRAIKSGDLFWALRGEKFDGHDFFPQVIRGKAAGAVVESRYIKVLKDPDRLQDRAVVAVDNTLAALGDLARWWRSQHNVKIVAITGSAGKTTTKEMIAEVLSLSKNTLKNYGNFNNLIGLPLTLLRLTKKHCNVVVEMGMNQFGEIARLTEIADPDIGLITNVGGAHLKGVGDLKGVAKAKAELIEKISSKGLVIVNGDDKLLVTEASNYRDDFVTFGMGESNDVRGRNIKNMGKKGVSFELSYKGKSWPVTLTVPGLQNIPNALAAATVCLCLNEPVENIRSGLAHFKGVKGRFQVSFLPGNITLVDDTYNSNPASLKAALDSIKALREEGRRVIVGLADMLELGKAASPAHIEAGYLTAHVPADYFVALGKHAAEMIKGAVNAGMPSRRVKKVFSHNEMAEIIKGEMTKGCLIFLKGSRRMGLENVLEKLTGLE
jgi:UDP-N-acetylmuramoyl-tripeptide--D-alanyl-D-alanine ligase